MTEDLTPMSDFHVTARRFEVQVYVHILPAFRYRIFYFAIY